jgi:hypothetical protein
MNDNIRRLLAQAYLEQADIRDTTKIAEQFAELIVKECADFADEHNDASEGVTLGVGKAIKQHFGVEE